MNEAVEISLNDLRCWERDGESWACAATDHGPFCRLCQPADDVLASCLESVDLGLMALWYEPTTGEFRFRVTQKGNAQVESMIQTDPEMAQFYADLQQSGYRPSPEL